MVGCGCDAGGVKPASDSVGDDAVEDTASAVDSVNPGGDTLEILPDIDGADSVADDADTTVAEVAVDACEEVSCEVPADRCNADRSGVVVSSDAKCVTDGGAFECTAIEATVPCTYGTEFCIDERCMTHAEFCLPDPKRRWTYYTKLAAGDQSDPRPDGTIADQCCFDFNGDDKIDNRLGQIFWQNRALLGNMNEIAAKNIRDGLLKMLVEVRGLPDPEGDAVDPDAPVNAEHIEIIGAGGSGAQGGQDPATGLAVSGLHGNIRSTT
jgi:hypothetical protein